MSFSGQLQRAHRLMKNPNFDSWQLASALFAYATTDLQRVLIAVDWTDLGSYKVLEASLVVERRAIPFYCLVVHKEELKNRQTTLEMTLWYGLSAMRREGQSLIVVADRGFAKFDFIGQSPLYPYIHLVVRLKGNTILTWVDVSGQLSQWPLWEGETVEIEEAILGGVRQVESAVCLTNLGEKGVQTLYLACAKEDCSQAVSEYGKRSWVEEQNRDIKSGINISRGRLGNARRIERLWVIAGIAFYISYCNEAAHDLEFARRMGRAYKDGRKDLSWFSLAIYAEMSGQCELKLRSLAAQ
jgi:hypothetical protein